MSPGLAFGLLAALAWGIVDVCAAISTRYQGSLRVLAGSQSVSLLTLVVLAMGAPSLLGDDPLSGIVAGLPIGILSGLVYLSYFTTLRMGPVSIVSPVIVAYGGLTVILAVVFRGEALTIQQAAGALLATAGVVLAGITFHAGDLRRVRIVGPGVILAVVTLIGFAVLVLLLASPIRAHGWLPVMAGARIGNCGIALVLLGVALRSRSRWFRPLLQPDLGWPRMVIVVVVLGGVFDIVGFIALSVGLSVAPVWLVGLASSFGPMLAVGYGIWRLGERPHRTQWAGLALIGIGVVVLALAG